MTPNMMGAGIILLATSVILTITGGHWLNMFESLMLLME